MNTRLNQLLNKPRGALQNLLEDAQLFQALLEVGLECVPENLQPHLLGVSFNENSLIIQIDEAIWATQLRFYEPTLLSVYQQHFPHLELNRVKIKVLPQPAPVPKRKKNIQPPDAQAVAEMQQLSQKVTSPGLKEALINLSKRGTN